MEPTPELRKVIETVKKTKNVSMSGEINFTTNTHSCRDH